MNIKTAAPHESLFFKVSPKIETKNNVPYFIDAYIEMSTADCNQILKEK